MLYEADLQGFFQVELDKESKAKSAFVTPTGHYQFKVMAMGLCNAPATFQRLMDRVLHKLTWKQCIVYLDDVIVYSRTFEEHLVRLENTVRNTRIGEPN
jgi:hypothetical protein